MEVKTINPILVNPQNPNVNGYVGSTSLNIDLQGQSQDVNVGDFVVKGTNPVFIGNQEASRNEFLYSEPVMLGNQTLTPNDEYLWSNLTAEERRARRETKRATRKTTATMAEIQANLQDIPGGPTKGEQEAKLKEGKFWNGVKGGWDSFKTSPSGQILIDSVTNYLSNKLGGNSFSQGGGAYDDIPAVDDKTKDEPMSKTTKYVLIGGGVLLVGIIAYSVLSKK
jgi:hypothetical protein